jgi:hypothetical protein
MVLRVQMQLCALACPAKVLTWIIFLIHILWCFSSQIQFRYSRILKISPFKWLWHYISCGKFSKKCTGFWNYKLKSFSEYRAIDTSMDGALCYLLVFILLLQNSFRVFNPTGDKYLRNFVVANFLRVLLQVLYCKYKYCCKTASLLNV